MCSAFLIGNASAYDDKPIEMSQLPAKAQELIKTHFAKSKVSYAMVDKSLFGNDYKVVFDNANQIEFDKNGEWTDLECKVGGVPKAIVPSQIEAYVTKNHLNNNVVKIEKSKLGYEIELSNGMELTFDSKLQFFRYDD